MAKHWVMKASALALTASMLIAGCGGARRDQAPTPTPTPGAEQPAKKFRVGMVTDTGGLNDESFNAAAWAGLKRAESELQAEIKAVESKRQEDYQTNYQLLADANFDLVWGIGFLMEEDTGKIAQKLTSQKFGLIDGTAQHPNVASVLFKEEEGSFLMGVLAARTTKSKKVGFVGGIAGDVIDHFEAGFKAGIKAIDPSVQVITVYTGSFIDPAKGKEVGLSIIGQGADIVFHAAGNTGQGVIEAAKEKGVFAIGVDRDQNALAPQTVISSMMKRVDVAVFTVSQQTQQGKFPGGQVITLGLKEDGVGYAPSTLWDKTPAGTKELVDQWAQAIKDGRVTVPNSPDKLNTWEVPKI